MRSTVSRRLPRRSENEKEVRLYSNLSFVLASAGFPRRCAAPSAVASRGGQRTKKRSDSSDLIVLASAGFPRRCEAPSAVACRDEAQQKPHLYEMRPCCMCWRLPVFREGAQHRQPSPAAMKHNKNRIFSDAALSLCWRLPVFREGAKHRQPSPAAAVRERKRGQTLL